MEIVVNNKDITVPSNYALKDLLKKLNYSKTVAIFVNGKQLLQSEYDSFIISENDNLKVIKPLGGG